MSRFTAATYKLTDQTKRGRPMVELTSPLVYEISYLGSGWLVRAETGYRTDLASFPSWLLRFRVFCSLAHRIARSSIVHDKLRENRGHPKIVSDYVFFEAMGVDRVALGWRLLVFLVVLLNFSRD